MRCLPFLLSLLMMTSAGEKVATLPHGLYLSVVQIDHSHIHANANMLIKVFSNDLQDVIRATYPNAWVRSEAEAFCRLNKASIEAYFQEKLNCRINGRAAMLSFLESTKENDVFWLKFTLKAPDEWEQITIQASFFMEIFSGQSNIIQVTHASEKRFARLTKSEPVVKFTF